MKKYDESLSQYIADAVEVMPKQCWRNALLAAHALLAMGNDDVRYVEGYVVIEVGRVHISGADPVDTAGVCLPIEHGWVTVGDSVVDVTLNGLRAPKAFFPGVSWDGEEAIKLALGNTLPLFISQGGALKMQRAAEAAFTWISEA